MSLARSSWFASRRSNHLRRIIARSFAVFLLHAGKARLAASIAWRASLEPRSGTLAMISPVAGLSTGNVLLAVIHSPSIYAASRKSPGSLNCDAMDAVFGAVSGMAVLLERLLRTLRVRPTLCNG